MQAAEPGNPDFWGCARPFGPNNQEQKTVDRYCWMDQPKPTLSMAGKWVPGRHFHGIVPRKLGLKGVVLGLFLQSKGVKRGYPLLGFLQNLNLVLKRQ